MAAFPASEEGAKPLPRSPLSPPCRAARAKASGGDLERGRRLGKRRGGSACGRRGGCQPGRPRPLAASQPLRALAGRAWESGGRHPGVITAAKTAEQKSL